jgi:hypothetical protein
MFSTCSPKADLHSLPASGVSFVGGHGGFHVLDLFHFEMGANLSLEIVRQLRPTKQSTEFGKVSLPAHGHSCWFKSSDPTTARVATASAFSRRGPFYPGTNPTAIRNQSELGTRFSSPGTNANRGNMTAAAFSRRGLFRSPLRIRQRYVINLNWTTLPLRFLQRKIHPTLAQRHSSGLITNPLLTGLKCM